MQPPVLLFRGLQSLGSTLRIAAAAAQRAPAAAPCDAEAQGPCCSTASTSSSLFSPGRRMSSVRMVLLEDHEHLGPKGSIVKVAAGYARHTLFPRKEADYAIPSVLKELKEKGWELRDLSRTKRDAQRKLTEEEEQEEIVKRLKSRTVIASRRVSRNFDESSPKHMVGGVSKRQLQALVARQLNIDLPLPLILMESDKPITAFGTYRVPLDFYTPAGEQVELSLEVRKTYRSGKGSGHRAAVL